MRKTINWKSILITLVGLALFSCAYVLLTLFAVPVSPVEYKSPPDLVQQIEPSDNLIAVSTDEHDPPPAIPALARTTREEIEALAKGVLINGQSPEQFAALFGHPDPDVRAAAAHALALYWTANMGMAEPRADGPELMRRYEFMQNFWKSADKSEVLKTFLEALSNSVENVGSELHGDDWQILYVLSGSGDQKTERAEILAWVANHHPSEDMRRSAMFFLINRGKEFPRAIGDEVLDSRAHDPALRVRFEAWKQRMQRIPSDFFGGK